MELLKTNPLIEAGIVVAGGAYGYLQTFKHINPLDPKANHPDLPTYSLSATRAKDTTPYRSNTAQRYISTRRGKGKNSVYRSGIMSTVQINSSTNIDKEPTLFTAYTNYTLNQVVLRTSDRAVAVSGIRSHYFSMNDLINSGAIAQRQRLFYLLNLFQEYRLKKVTIEYKPAVYSATTELTNALRGAVVSGNTAYVSDVRAKASNPWDMVLYHDRNDIAGSTSTSLGSDTNIIYEIFTMEDMQGVVRFLSSEYLRHTFDLNAYAAIASSQDPNLPSTGGNFDMARPIEAPWVPTKIWDTTTSNWAINTAPLTSSVKIGYYSLPLYSSTTSDTAWLDAGVNSMIVPLGNYTITWCAEFRMREFRPIYGNIPTALLVADTNEVVGDGQNNVFLTQDIQLTEEEKDGTEPLNKKPRIMKDPYIIQRMD